MTARRLEMLAMGAGFLVLTGLQLWRQPGAPSYDTVFAEDGPVFLADALHHRLLDGVIEPYAGYVLIVPRMIAATIVLFPLEYAALLLAVVSCALVSALALYVYAVTGFMFRRKATRVVLAFLVALAPVAAHENTANVANLHWAFDLAAFWALVAPVAGAGLLGVGVLVVVSAALSDALVALLAPLALWQVARSPARGRRLIGAAFLLGVAVQFLLRGGEAKSNGLGVEHLPEVFGVRVAGSMLVGERFLYDLHDVLGPALPLLALLTAGVLFVAAWRILDPSSRAVIALCAGYAVAFFVATVGLRGSALLEVADGAPRYMYLPVVLLCTIPLALADRLPERFHRGPAVAAVIGAVLLFGALSSMRLPTQRSLGPRWNETVNTARASCDAPGQKVTLRHPPQGFVTRLNCEDLFEP